MAFKEQILASFIGTLFGFIFAVVLFLTTNYFQQKLASRVFKKHLKREFKYDIKLLQNWIEDIEKILRKIAIKDKQIYQYIKYSDLGRYFMDESFKLGLIYNSFSDDQIFNLNKLVTHCSLSSEQYVNNKIAEWKNCPIIVEDKLQKELLKYFEYQKDQLSKFKIFLEDLLKIK